MTEQDFLQQYDTLLTSLSALDISEQQYRAWVEASLLSERLLDQMRAEVPAEADQVKVRVLVAESEELANELAARLDAGEDFQVLKEELEESSDDQVAGYGSELSWAPREVLESRLGAELVDLAFGLEVGDHSQPVLGQDGSYVVIEVIGHEVRELSQAFRDQMGEEAFQKWLEVQQVLVERRTYEERVPSEP
jgi:parvulin-like peptidyl-prolyl isomerase